MEATILFFDTETNSLDTDRGTIMELAWAIYDVRKMRLLSAHSHLLRWNMHYEVDPGALATTGLTKEFCEENGDPAGEVFSKFLLDCSKSFAVAGHNVLAYDKPIIRTNILRSLFNEPKSFMDQFTFDTMYDCPYPSTQKQMALKYLAFDHGHIMSDAHQALADVFACASVFFKYKFTECLEIARTPLMTINGYTDYHDEVGREKFYQAKFRWNKPRKRWEKTARAFYIPGTQLLLGDYPIFNETADKIVVLDSKQLEETVQPFNNMEIPF